MLYVLGHGTQTLDVFAGDNKTMCEGREFTQWQVLGLYTLEVAGALRCCLLADLKKTEDSLVPR